MLGEFKKAGSEPKSWCVSFVSTTDLPEGDVDLTVTQFQPGDYVDVIGRSKGKGFQGVMKKHNFHGQGAAHGSKTHRRNGAVGNRSTPGRIWKNMGMPGHLGDERVTVQNLQIMQVREAEKIILVSGAVPGSNGSYVVVRPAVKNPAAQIKTAPAHGKKAEAGKKPEAAAKKPEAPAKARGRSSERRGSEAMSAKVLTKAAAKEAKIDMIEGGRGTQAVHDVVVAMRAARRSGSANTKTKAEVDISGSKPWRQKGTGRARAGYASSPIWRGGGVVFGPKPRDYTKKVSKTLRHLAFRKALSERISAGDVLTIDKLAVSEIKTKSFVDLVKKATDARKVLLISDSFDEKTLKSARNVKSARLTTASDVNTEQLLAFEKILVTPKALERLAERTR